MNRLLLCCTVLLLPSTGVLGDDATKLEAPFRESAQVFVDAYAKQDAEAIGELFTEDAEFHDEYGERTTGRKAIVELFEGVFADSPDALVEEIDVERVRLVNANVAIEQGVVASVDFAGGPRSVSRYVAIHVRGKDGQWRINTLRDFAQERNSRVERLAELDWMVGEWVSEDEDSVVHTEAKWSDDGNYILRRFTVQFAGRPVMSGVQRIGWDPVRRTLRSWTFDSAGGHVTGTWTRTDDQWLVVSSGYTADGRAASGLSAYTVHDAERITWQYRGLLVGNELRTNMAPVVLVRRPPAPGEK